MDIKHIKGNADIISAIIAQWYNTGSLGELERRLLVDKIDELRTGVEQASQPTGGAQETAEKEEPGMRLTEFSVDMESGEASNDTGDRSLNEVTGEEIPEIIERVTIVSAEIGIEKMTDEEQVPDSMGEAMSGEGVADLQDEEVTHPAGLPGRRGKVDRQTIRSLYEDDTAADVTGPAWPLSGSEVTHSQTSAFASSEDDSGKRTTSEPKPSEGETARGVSTERKLVLGDVINQGTATLGDSIAKPVDSVSSRLNSGKIDSVRKAIGLNDRYLITAELFDGDSEAYEEAVETLDSFTELDDAMLWIHDNYDWDAGSVGARLLADLLVRKLM